MSVAAPLRFLVIVLGGWICVRAVFLIAPQGEGDTEAVEQLPLIASRAPASVPRPPFARTSAFVTLGGSPALPPRRSGGESRPDLVLPAPVPPPDAVAQAAVARIPVQGNRSSPNMESSPPAPISMQSAPTRWTASGWLFLRRGAGPQLASGGALGGSQIGGRIGYRINQDAGRPLSLVARIYAPLRDGGTEAALGFEWKPSSKLPLRLLAERRQAIGEQGRDAFALLAYGGVSDERVTGPVLLDAYAQAGMVGLRSHDAFVDGMASLSAPIGDRVTAGAAVWGAAQPRTARLDAGPRLSWRAPIERFHVRVSAEWRFRIAGDAAPGSGPALTIGGDF